MLKSPDAIGKIVFDARMRQQLSKDKAARLCHVTYTTYDRIESAKVVAHIRTLRLVSRGLNIPFASFSTTPQEEEEQSKTLIDIANFVGQELDKDDGYYYYRQFLDAVEVKCLAYNGDGVVKGGGTLHHEERATLDCFIGEQHWFLHSIFNDGTTLGVKLFDLKGKEFVIDHTNPNAIDVLQQLLAARWRPNPLKEDEV